MFRKRFGVMLAAAFLTGSCLGAFAQETAPSKPQLPPKYDKWLNEEVVYIISPLERSFFLKLQNDREREIFIEKFWSLRQGNASTPGNVPKDELYRRLEYANKNLGTASTPGWKTAAGRNHIVFGRETPWVMKMRILEAFRDTSPGPALPVTSSYLKYRVSATMESENDLAEELNQVQRTFNFRDVRLLTEADFHWSQGDREEASNIFSLDGKKFSVAVTPIDVTKRPTFHIAVFEKGEKEMTNLLDTEFSIPIKNIAVFGFEDAKGSVYFLSFRISGLTTPTGEIEFRPASQIWADVQGKGPVRATGKILPPKLLKQVNPVYPEDARKAGIEGIVILEATTDTEGHVSNTKVLRSIPMLDQAASDAVKQWIYEPLFIDGKPRGVVFTVTVRFLLDQKKAAVGSEPKGGSVGGVLGGRVGNVTEDVKTPGDIKPPGLIKKVDPVYPEAARKAGIEGIVILEVQTDQDGRVQNTKVLRSIPELDQAAIDAIKQWVYEPVKINGKPRPAIFTVTVRFALK